MSRMRRDLLHVTDMLDERFAYQREAIAGLPARQNLVRDRYRVLWDTFVEGRLDREGRGDRAAAERLKGLFSRVFANPDGSACLQAFDRVFRTETLDHGSLLKWARTPEALFDEAAGSASLRRQAPGGRCPLCGFPTHDWFEFRSNLDDAVADAIGQHHAGWCADSGACRQCAEIYTAAVAGVRA
ncbi:MAG: hypothetical protein ACYSVY_09820 [Planctomycetota bacterium]